MNSRILHHLRPPSRGTLFCGLLFFSAGCASSPLERPYSGPNAGQVAILGATTAGGAALGNQTGSKWGAPIGAAAGLGVGLLTNAYFSSKERRAYDEGYEQGRREARVEVMRQYWYEKTTSLPPMNEAGPRGPMTALPETSYQAGVVEGVRYAPRSSSQPTLTEPVRP